MTLFSSGGISGCLPLLFQSSILLSPLRERRGGRRRGILMDVGCMGIAGAEFLYLNEIKIIYGVCDSGKIAHPMQ